MDDVETHVFADGGAIPNSRLPVLVYRGVEAVYDPRQCEQLFAENGWRAAWRNGIYSFHHFHSIAHEVLGVVGGSATVMLGGPEGERLEIATGDVLVLPAGTGHRNLGSQDLIVVGAYPDGMEWDLRRGGPTEHDEAVVKIAAVPLPAADPVHGPDGPLVARWSMSAESA